MHKKFQIFVSSTYEDLKEERRSVIEAILDMGQIPIGMEAFQAFNEEQWSHIKKRIDEADYYIIIVAERYGSITQEGVSYTEMEYDYARAKGVPVAAFLLHENSRDRWRRVKNSIPEDREKVDGLRNKCKNLLVRQWRNKDDLAASCVKSIHHMISRIERPGWVPLRNLDVADNLRDYENLRRRHEELLKEHNKCIAENERLRNFINGNTLAQVALRSEEGSVARSMNIPLQEKIEEISIREVAGNLGRCKILADDIKVVSDVDGRRRSLAITPPYFGNDVPFITGRELFIFLAEEMYYGMRAADIPIRAVALIEKKYQSVISHFCGRNRIYSSYQIKATFPNVGELLKDLKTQGLVTIKGGVVTLTRRSEKLREVLGVRKTSQEIGAHSVS